MKSNGFTSIIHKTIKINVDENAHHLPPSLGRFPEYKVADYDCPSDWSKDGVFIPVKEGDAMWFDFTSNEEDCAIIVAVQKVNPVTGERVELKLSKDPKQNYLKMPEQRWLDGYSNDGKVYQFIVTKAGLMTAVNEYVLPVHEQDSYAIGFAFFGLKNPKPRVEYRHPVVNVFNDHHGNDEALTIGALGTQKRFTQNRVSDNNNDAVYESNDIVTNPMWFSPVHAPQNWNIHSKRNMLKSASYNTAGQTDYSADMVAVNFSSVLRGAATENAAPILEKEVKTSGGILPEITDGRYEKTIYRIESEQSEIDHTTFEKASMGQGGRIAQDIISDSNTVDYYKEEPSVIINYYLCLPEQFKEIMNKGRRSDSARKDKFVNSGKIGPNGIQIPLIK